MCKKEKYEKHRNVLVSFFASAMLVILNSQKLSLTVRSINWRSYFISLPQLLTLILIQIIKIIGYLKAQIGSAYPKHTYY